MSVLRLVCASALVFALSNGCVRGAERQGVTGLWRSIRDFGPRISGRIVVQYSRAGTIATIGGVSVPVAVDGAELRFALPGDQGRFRGHLTNEALTGFWIQPATTTLGVEYASPVTLRKNGPGIWNGEIIPLRDRLTLYLEVDRNADGSLSGFIRNPELNFGHGRPLAIALDGDRVKVSDPIRHQTSMQGRYDETPDRLTLKATPMDIDFTFSRVDPEQAPGFAPRPASGRYVYRVPVIQNDGWKTGSLSGAGMDEEAIAVLIRRIVATAPAAGATPYIDSLLIARYGRLVLEEYFDGFDSETPHSLRSASKSVTSMLLGAAIDHGAPISVTTPIASQFQNYQPFANPDRRKMQIAVQNLLTMTSGLACDDDDDDSPGNEDNMQNQTAQPDWYKYTLDLPMVAAPGGKAVYCSAGVNLVGGIIHYATGRWLPELFEDYLAKPLQIRRYYMNLMPTGEGYAGGGLTLRPRDALKFGQLYLDRGIWNHRRIVSSDWVTASTTTRSKIHDDSTYGYNWWLYTLHVGDRTYDEWEMGGNGGQIVAVIPALDLVIGFTASNYGRFDIWSKFQNDLIPNAIVPAASPTK